MRDRVAVVTGAGRGNGEAIARRLAAEGAHVVLGDLLLDEVTGVAGDIEAKGGRATALRCDVSREDEVEALMAAAEELGGPHAVVAQAGARHEGGLMATDPAKWDAFMAVDVRGTYLCARAAVPRMRRLGGGSIVTMSGTFAIVPEPGIAVQAAGKGAILALTRAIAVEHGPDNIRCNAIVPGYIETPMVERWANDHPDPAAARQAVTSMHALRRLGTPEEIAAMALFLCSDESSFSTGHPFPVDGGLSIGMNNIYEFDALRGNTGRGLDA
ncbi:SDR family NAD(P)-dependent oxidoreductase [Streptomyces profundus]|uniref:SDR family NAD(P)-dependent oxidoreductase n=1 Tax=Streptomyces profundus TaxID=2867410 RepID=UPI001D16F233|nr:SDR family oxidoreductase [Streptomyces sp. MA3_2.13]UED83942.1 SDR family oxidoreductase [Streptomyces sp. MA3_2.13]